MDTTPWPEDAGKKHTVNTEILVVHLIWGFGDEQPSSTAHVHGQLSMDFGLKRLTNVLFHRKLSRAISLKPAAKKHNFTTRISQTHCDVIVNDVIIRLCVYNKIG